MKNTATIGGNLCNASPASDTAPPLIVLSSRVKLISSSEEREMPIEEFFVGPGRTALRRDEMLAEILIPKAAAGYGAFSKLGKRMAHVLSIVNVAAFLKVEDGRCDEARVALGSVAPTPIRAGSVEESLRGARLSDDIIHEACERVVRDINPISDIRASAEYRKEMSVVLTERTVKKALGRQVETYG